MKPKLQYAVICIDGTWAGLFSTPKQAVAAAKHWRRENKKTGSSGAVYVTKIIKSLSKDKR